MFNKMKTKKARKAMRSQIYKTIWASRKAPKWLKYWDKEEEKRLDYIESQLKDLLDLVDGPINRHIVGIDMDHIIRNVRWNYKALEDGHCYRSWTTEGQYIEAMRSELDVLDALSSRLYKAMKYKKTYRA